MSYLNASMTTQVEVKLWGVGDFCVHCGTSWNVSTFSNLCEKEMQRHWGTTQRGFVFFFFSPLYGQENKHEKKSYKKQKVKKECAKLKFCYNWKSAVSLLWRKKKRDKLQDLLRYYLKRFVFLNNVKGSSCNWFVKFFSPSHSRTGVTFPVYTWEGTILSCQTGHLFPQDLFKGECQNTLLLSNNLTSVITAFINITTTFMAALGVTNYCLEA